MRKHIRLGWHFKPGLDWLHTDVGLPQLYSAHHLANIARQAEDALFDIFFQADTFEFEPESARHSPPRFTEPFATLGAVVAATNHIGLVATASTTFNEPYSLARQVSTLDLLSEGRAGWNAVTSFKGFGKFGREIPAADWRYARADEFITAVNRLWTSWDADAVIYDRVSGTFADPERIHAVDLSGEHVSLHGAGALPRSAQNLPVQFQAGASEPGLQLAAKHADAVFSASPDIIHARDFFRNLKERVAKQGRDPDKFLIFKGFNITLAPTREEARDRYHQYTGTVDYDDARRTLESYLGGTDLSDLELDEPLPLHRLPHPDHTQGIRSRIRIVRDLAEREGFTLRTVLEKIRNGHGHYATWGSADDIAAEMIDWFDNEAADGFVITFQGPGNQIDDFTAGVIPQLQDRGYFRRKYTGTHLRENLGIV